MSATSEHLEEVEVLRSIYEDAVETNPQWLTGGSAATWHVRVKQLGTIARPMALVLRLPPAYPASAPPVFEIVADWLPTSKNAELSSQLVRGRRLCGRHRVPARSHRRSFRLCGSPHAFVVHVYRPLRAG